MHCLMCLSKHWLKCVLPTNIKMLQNSKIFTNFIKLPQTWFAKCCPCGAVLHSSLCRRPSSSALQSSAAPKKWHLHPAGCRPYIASQRTETVPGQNMFPQNNEHVPHFSSSFVPKINRQGLMLWDLEHPVKRSSLIQTKKVKFSNIVFRPKNCLVPEITS